MILATTWKPPSLVVNNQGQRTMKEAIICLSIILELKVKNSFLLTKCIKDKSYQNMSMLVSCGLIFFNEKKWGRFNQFLTWKNDFESQTCPVFQPSIQKWPKGKNYFHKSCLFTTELSCLQKNSFIGITYLFHAGKIWDFV